MKQALGPTCLAYPMPAFLVGTYDETGKPNVMTAAWGGICNSDPPCVAVSVRPSRWTHHSILLRKAFTISIPSVKLATETDFVGIVGGKKIDKFTTTKLTPVRSALVDAPYVQECPVVLECELLTSLELPSHTQFIGRIVNVGIDEDCLTEDGKPNIEIIDPLLYNGGQRHYHRIGEKVANAFSVGKRLI